MSRHSGQVDALVMMGATGDLARLDIIPALYGLVERRKVDIPVIGVGKSGWELPDFHDHVVGSLRQAHLDPDSPGGARLLELLDYVDGDLTDPRVYEVISDKLGPRTRPLFHLAVPPELYGRVAVGIAAVGRSAGARLMVEKPYGTDLAHARTLDATLHRHFDEEAIYRVGHWLGPGPIENLLFVRFANSVLEPLLNRTYVRSVQVTVADALDVADRGARYDRTGAIRDVVQNHLLQVLATVLADPPVGTGVAQWPDQTTTLLKSLQPIAPQRAVRGQYDGYLKSPGVASTSTVETFVAAAVESSSWRWAGVPIVIRAGTCLPVTATDVTIRFRPPPHNVAGLEPFGAYNTLRFRISPVTAVDLTLASPRHSLPSRPGLETLAFAERPGQDRRPYEHLLEAALTGDHWLFARDDAVEAAWRVVEPILGDAVPLRTYDGGTWGPREADVVLPYGESWHNPDM